MVKCCAYRCDSASYKKHLDWPFIGKDEITRNAWMKNMKLRIGNPILLGYYVQSISKITYLITMFYAGLALHVEENVPGPSNFNIVTPTTPPVPVSTSEVDNIKKKADPAK